MKIPKNPCKFTIKKSLFCDYLIIMTPSQTYTDEQLLKMLKEGSENAFTMIYYRYWDSLYYASLKRLKDFELCRDIVQNVFTSVWDRRGALEIDNLKAYLYGAVRFQVLKAVGRDSGSSYFIESFTELVTAPEHADNLVLEREIQRLLQHFIDALPEKRRVIFLKRYMENFSTQEIAMQLGVSRKTVQNQLNNAEVALRSRLVHFLSLALVVSSFHRN